MTTIGFAQSTPAADSLKVKLNSANSDSIKLNLIEELFDFWIYKNYDSAYVYAEFYLEIAKKIKDRQAESTGFTLIAWVYDFQGDIIKAKEYYEKALEIRREIGDQKLIANALSNLGVMYYYASDFENAIDYYLQAIKVREEIKDSMGLGQSYNNMGVLMRNQGEYEKAIEYYTQAAEIKNELGDEYSYLSTLINIGTLYATVGQHQQALSYAQEALVIAEKNNDQVSVGQLNLNMGAAYTGLGQYSTGKRYIRDGLQILEEVGEKGLAFEGYNMLINNHLKSGEYLKADEAVQMASEHLDEATDLETLHEYYTLSSRAFALSNNYQKAYEYQLLESKLQDSLFQQSSRDAMLELETKYEVEKKEQELELLSAQNALSRVEIARSNSVRNYVAIIALLTIGAFIVVYINYRKRKALSEQLAEQNKIINENLSEKELLIQEIHHRVKNNLQIISSLLNIQSRKSGNISASSVLKESKNRVQSMAMIHQRLYQHKNLTTVQMQDYIGNLVRVLVNSYGMEEKVTVVLDIEDIELDVDTTIPLALILNELITNAVKHAFTDLEQAKLSVKLKEVDNQLHLNVIDNGKGMDTFAETDNESSFGLHLIKTLSQKLDAEFKLNHDNGLSVNLVIKNYQRAS
jgi:two-component sensor histidine kinase/Tfp pilus assembly protein PilF